MWIMKINGISLEPTEGYVPLVQVETEANVPANSVGKGEDADETQHPSVQ